MIISRALIGLAAVLGSLIAGSMAMRHGGVDPTHGTAPAALPAEGEELGIESTPRNVPAEAIRLMEEGRPWRAARFMAGFLGGTAVPTAEAILFAARAESEWGGWSAARAYLEGKPWLDELDGGEGWCILGRALEESGEVQAAVDAYASCLSPEGGRPSPRVVEIAELRSALLQLRLSGAASGDVLARVRQRSPEIEDWLNVLSTESLAATGDTTGVRLLTLRLPQEAGMRHRGRVALLRAYQAAGDHAGLIRTAGALRDLGGTATQRAELSLMAGRAAVAAGDAGAARRELREAIRLAPGSGSARDAATLLLDVQGIGLADRLAIAEVDERHGNSARAARGFRAWLEAGSGSSDERQRVQLRLGRALFNAGEFSNSEATLRPLLGGPPAIAREALMLTGRSEYRRGAVEQAFATFERLASSHPRSVEGSEALYLVADLRHDGGETRSAANTYRRVATEFPGTDRAGLSLMRLAGIHYLTGDYSNAAAVWEEYRSSYPAGERWLQATYWAARAYEQLGDAGRAAPLYQAVRRRDALSYYAVRAAERLGMPFWPVSMGAAPGDDPAARQLAESWLAGVDLLRSAGLHTEAEAELDRVIARAGSNAPHLYALAEALNERGYAIRGIRIGQDLQRSGINLRLLRILYPFPYREIVEAEAREKDLDPFVVAALMRQESLFTARISSPVGARGLMQIMPETGDALARGVGIDEWSADLLFQPEINIHLGTRYLAEQMDRYDGSLPSVFSAYNAGPHRIDAWKELPEFGDEELFTERIPYRETRDYVKILTRNIELYRRLYGG